MADPSPIDVSLMGNVAQYERLWSNLAAQRRRARQSPKIMRAPAKSGGRKIAITFKQGGRRSSFFAHGARRLREGGAVAPDRSRGLEHDAD